MIVCLVNYEIQFITFSKNIMVYGLSGTLLAVFLSVSAGLGRSKEALAVTNQLKLISLISFRASHAR